MNTATRWIILALAGITLLAGCARTINVYRYQYDSVMDEVYLKQGVDFSGYTALMIDDISVWRPSAHLLSPEDAKLARANLARAQALFRDTVSDAFSDRYAITRKPDRHVLRVQVEFIDLRALQPDEPLPADLNRLRVRTQPGHITMIARLLDSLSGEQLARAADLGKQQSFGSYTLVDWEAIAADFDYWAQVFRTWLDRMHAPG
ncbi:MAG: DUF3313 family protein [Xanthomonadales bacterium]|nr:DUF3313 family protein [Xanthomonadales bacterium]